MKWNRKHKDWLWGYFFIAPTILGLIVLNIWPIVQTLMLSFSEYLGFNQFEFSGFGNYERLLQDEAVWLSLRNTLIFTFLSVPIGIAIALVFASMMSTKIRFVGVYRVIYFLPMVAAPAAIAMVWKWIFNTEYGVLNAIIEFFGGEPVSWISDPKVAMISMVIIAIWSGLGNQIIILIAGITGISRSYYEAAEMDGAGPVRRFFTITVPLVSPTIFFLAITGMITALRQFDMIFMIYNNTTNPAIDSVRTIMYQYYIQAFAGNDKAYASAIVMLAFSVILVFTAVQFIAQKKWVHYE